MNDSEKSPKSHWDQLAAEIGADVSKEEKSLEQENRPASPVVPHRKPKSSPPRQRPQSDWNALAAELGATPAPVEPPDQRRGRPGGEKPFDSADVTPRVSSEAADIVEPQRVESEAGGRSVGEDSSARKRPSRRRRPRRGRSKTSGKETTGEQGVLEEAEGGFEESLEPVPNGTADDGGEKDTPTEERRRRRRRKRRPAKKPDSAEQSADIDETSRQLSDDDADDTRSHLASDDDDREERKSRPMRGGHRNIPTWHEAINMIVEANIELHKSQPARSGSGSQRGRGRGRGGRSRGRKKT